MLFLAVEEPFTVSNEVDPGTYVRRSCTACMAIETLASILRTVPAMRDITGTDKFGIKEQRFSRKMHANST